jgi:AraC-like DNA-binding protein
MAENYLSAEIFMAIHQKENSLGNYIFNEVTYGQTDWEPHYHKSYEVVTVLEGRLHTVINGREQDIYPGEYLLVLQNQIHAYESSPGVKYWVAVFSEDFVPKFTSGIKGMQSVNSVFKPDKTVDGLIKSGIMGKESSHLLKKACLYAICDSYMKSGSLENRRTASDSTVSEVIDYVSLHYNENVTLSKLSERLGYEYHYLSRLLKNNYKINIRDLINSYRVSDATELMRTTPMNITEIAMKSGFQSIRNFNYIFKQSTGKTPREYRLTECGIPDASSAKEY